MGACLLRTKVVCGPTTGQLPRFLVQAHMEQVITCILFAFSVTDVSTFLTLALLPPHTPLLSVLEATRGNPDGAVDLSAVRGVWQKDEGPRESVARSGGVVLLPDLLVLQGR